MTPFRGRDLLVAATFLATHTEDEGSQRSAISRSYYACFHRARDYSRARSAIVRPDGSAHVAVRRLIGTTAPSLEWDLLRLHTLRKYADYDIPFPDGDPTHSARVALALAASIIARIDAIARESVSPSQED